MSIFLCWSGDRSHDLARAAETLVRKTLNLKEGDVFVSDHIEKGVAWFDSIVTNLQNAAAGIVCLTAENTENSWLHFEAGALAMRLAKVPSDQREHFQRKTFNEPLYRCADQAWLRRYDGARLTHDKLAPQLDRVKAVCSAHEHGLFEMLVDELDGYAMAIQSLLLTPKTFTLEDREQLKRTRASRRAAKIGGWPSEASRHDCCARSTNRSRKRPSASWVRKRTRNGG